MGTVAGTGSWWGMAGRAAVRGRSGGVARVLREIFDVGHPCDERSSRKDATSPEPKVGGIDLREEVGPRGAEQISSRHQQRSSIPEPRPLCRAEKIIQGAQEPSPRRQPWDPRSERLPAPEGRKTRRSGAVALTPPPG